MCVPVRFYRRYLPAGNRAAEIGEHEETDYRVVIGVLSMKEVPIWEKSNLTLEEAAAYSGIGINKLRDLTSGQNCQFVLWVGSKRLIKRRLFDKFIEQEYSI